MNLTRWKSPSYRYQDIPNFHYPPLKSSKTGIRLAVIQPGTGSKALSIKLIDSFVTGPKDNLAPYDALSYTWGTGPRSKHILCNGKRMQVTETLLAALHRFRRPHHEVTLWIDQICICQERVKERNQQVQMMGDIFKGKRSQQVEHALPTAHWSQALAKSSFGSVRTTKTVVLACNLPDSCVQWQRSPMSTVST